MYQQTQKLFAEHGEMSKHAEELVVFASSLSSNRPLPDAFRHRVRQFLETVRKHEASENRLVQEALNQDLGADD
jgi:hypothetical protein